MLSKFHFGFLRNSLSINKLNKTSRYTIHSMVSFICLYNLSYNDGGKLINSNPTKSNNNDNNSNINSTNDSDRSNNISSNDPNSNSNNLNINYIIESYTPMFQKVLIMTIVCYHK